MSDFNKNTAKGMRDFLPPEKEFREKLLTAIRSVYASFGFREIETPCVEDINNLTGRQGGENEKLIYKILKRGDGAENAADGQLCDLGLRFDLTVPLARYYAANAANLPSVFKSVQIGNVWRAERPQKGRFRQFVQCDIDIIGEQTRQAEIELLLASCAALKAVGVKDFTVKVNDRRILKGLAAVSGISEDKIDTAFIALDKLDKVGRDKVVEELEQREINSKTAADFTDNAVKIAKAKDALKQAEKLLEGKTDREVFDNLNSIISTVQSISGCSVEFDSTLVRGMGYYTGPIFEVVSKDFDSSICGGGRYDEMLGRFLGKSVPACGISIGFERIAAILNGKTEFLGNNTIKAVIFIESEEDFLAALLKAEQMRKQGKICLIAKKNKNFAFQKAQLISEGYTEFLKPGQDG